MNLATIGAFALVLTSLGYFLGCRRAYSSVAGNLQKLHSLPPYHGLHAALWVALPSVALLLVWPLLSSYLISNMVTSSLPLEIRTQDPHKVELILNDIRQINNGNAVIQDNNTTIKDAAEYQSMLEQMSNLWLIAVIIIISASTYLWHRKHFYPQLRARHTVEKTVRILLIGCSTISIFVTIGIFLSLLFESIKFFSLVPIGEFLFGLDWSPQMAIRDDQVGSSGAFGSVPLIVGTLVITFIAMIIAVPIGLMSAIYMSEYSNRRLRSAIKPLLEVLAGIPTVVYGFFAALTIAPFLRRTGKLIELDIASESALAAGLVMGIMIIPFVSSLSDDVMNSVPQSLRDGALALGATRSEMILQVVIPAALPGIVGSVLLAVSRAIGETMIVVMAAGLAANLTVNPFESVTTMTVQMVTLLVGDQEFGSAKTLAAFALGLLLFVITLCLNIVALRIVRKYREKYD